MPRHRIRDLFKAAESGGGAAPQVFDLVPTTGQTTLNPAHLEPFYEEFHPFPDCLSLDPTTHRIVALKKCYIDAALFFKGLSVAGQAVYVNFDVSGSWPSPGTKQGDVHTNAGDDVTAEVPVKIWLDAGDSTDVEIQGATFNGGNVQNS